MILFGLTGGLASWYYYHRKRKELLGGFWGGAAVGVLGAIIITFVSHTWFIELLNWMMHPKKIFGGIQLRVNLLTAGAGAFLFVYIMNRINHDKVRR